MEHFYKERSYKYFKLYWVKELLQVMPQPKKIWSPVFIFCVGMFISFLPAVILHSISLSRRGDRHKKLPLISLAVMVYFIFWFFKFLYIPVEYVLEITIIFNGLLTFFITLGQWKIYVIYKEYGGVAAPVLTPVIYSIGCLILFYSIQSGLMFITAPIYAHFQTQKTERALDYYKEGEVYKTIQIYEDIKNDKYVLIPDIYYNLASIYLYDYGDPKKAEQELILLENKFPKYGPFHQLSNKIDDAKKVLLLIEKLENYTKTGDVEQYLTLIHPLSRNSDYTRSIRKLFEENQLEIHFSEIRFIEIERPNIKAQASVETIKDSGGERMENRRDRVITFTSNLDDWYFYFYSALGKE